MENHDRATKKKERRNKKRKKLTRRKTMNEVLLMKKVTNLRHLASSTLSLTIQVSQSQSQAFTPKRIVTEHASRMGELEQIHIAGFFVLIFFPFELISFIKFNL